MRREHIKDGWWELPGEPSLRSTGPAPRTARAIGSGSPEPVQELLADVDGEGRCSTAASRRRHEKICAALKLERATPHDLRRTNGTTITGLGFGRRRDEPDSKSQGRRHRQRLRQASVMPTRTSGSWKPLPPVSWRWLMAGEPPTSSGLGLKEFYFWKFLYIDVSWSSVTRPAKLASSNRNWAAKEPEGSWAHFIFRALFGSCRGSLNDMSTQTEDARQASQQEPDA